MTIGVGIRLSPHVASWTPFRLGSSIVLWLRPERATLNGSNVSAIDDLSASNADAVQATPAAQMAYTTSDADFNGRPCITLAAGKTLRCAGGFTQISGLAGLTVYAVVKHLATANNFFVKTDATGTDVCGFALQVSGTECYSRSGATAGGYVDSSGSPLNLVEVWESTYDGTKGTDLTRLVLTRNGAKTSSSSFGTVPATLATANGYTIGSNTSSAKMTDLIVVNRALATDERLKMRRYLYALNGIAGGA